MKIKKIESLKDCGIFHNFQWKKGLPELKRYNLFYGWNGSGKTTLSNLLRCFDPRGDTPHPLPFEQGSFEINLINGESRTRKDYPTRKLPIRVFNRQFVDEVVHVKEGMKPIVFIGGEVKDAQKLDDLRKESQTYEEKMNPPDGSDSPRKQVTDLEKNHGKFLTDKARDVKERIRVGSYLSYNKRNLEETLDREFSDESQDGRYLLNKAELDVCGNQVESSTKKDKINDVQFSSMHRIRELKGEVATLLKRNVAHEPLKNVSNDDTKFSDWLFKGIELHEEEKPKRGKKGKCLFCENDLTMERMDELRKHFNKSYEALMEELNEKDEEIRKLISHIKDCDRKVPIKDQLYLKRPQDLVVANRLKKVKIDKVLKFLDCLQKRLDQKKSDFADDISDTLKDCESILDKDSDKNVDIFLEINKIIENHNKECDDHEGNIATSAKKIELHMVAQDISKFRELENNLKSKKRYYEDLQTKITQVTDEIKKIESELKKVRKPVEELNDELRSYLGHNDILLGLPEKDGLGYRVVRRHQDVSDKKSLSEGEKTALALLYFLKPLKGGSFDLKRGIVVIDDPISSMDSNFLYNAFGYIKARTEDAGQLLILTHNYVFFSLVRNWYQYRGKKERAFYMLKTRYDNGRRCRTAEICELDPLLRDYKSEYHYLFKMVLDASREKTEGGETEEGLERYYCMPNTARRLLESFLSLKDPRLAYIGGPILATTKNENTDVSLDTILGETTGFEKHRVTRIIRFINNYSHGSQIGEQNRDESLLSETPEILRDILDFIEKKDSKHYEVMCGIIEASNESPTP